MSPETARHPPHTIAKHRNHTRNNKRIKPKARPSDAYNDGSAVIPTGPEWSGPINYVAVECLESRVDTAHGRIRTGTSNNLTVERCGSRTDAAHGRMRMEREKLTAQNVRQPDTLPLLRARARTLRAKHERIRRCHEDYATHKFDFKSSEGEGSNADRIMALRHTNSAHDRWLDSTFLKLERDPAAIQRWDKANKRAGKKNAMWKARDDAVWHELERRRDEVHMHTPAPSAPVTSARAASFTAGSSSQGNTARAVYSATFYDDVARIQRELDEEDAGS